MKEPSVIHNTFVIERSFARTPAAVFAAFADPAKKRRWFVDSDNVDVEKFEMDFRVGGYERSQSRLKENTPFPGVQLKNEGRYEDIIPDQRIVTALAMMLGDKRISASLVTIELLATDSGTDLICTHQGAFFEGSGDPKMREEGWRKLLGRLDNVL